MWCMYVIALVFVWFFCFNHSGTPTGSFPENFMKIQLDLAEILWIRKLECKIYICLFVCLFVYKFVCILFQSSVDPYRKLPWTFGEDPTWFGWDIYDLKMSICLFVCLFVYWFVCFFVLIISGHPQEITLKIY